MISSGLWKKTPTTFLKEAGTNIRNEKFLPNYYFEKSIPRKRKKNNFFLFHRDSLEASQKILELNKKVEKVREDIYRLPGIEMNKEEQLAKMQNLKQQLKMKKDLIAKYKELNLKVNGLSGLHQAN